LLRSARAEMVQVFNDLFRAGWRRFQDRPDKRYSLTGSISFIAMERIAMGRRCTSVQCPRRSGGESLILWRTCPVRSARIRVGRRSSHTLHCRCSRLTIPSRVAPLQTYTTHRKRLLRTISAYNEPWSE
jgi:hypothetical protein